ncbi:MAG TPA: phage virion morphogenesis protein [Nitrospira sp.]|nr:phage virion morphogenesis protein [Nitrospira sp.]
MIDGYLVGDREAVARFSHFGPELQSQLVKRVTRLAFALQKRVQETKLSDQVLHVRTGRLRRSINSRVEEDGARVYGFVGTNVVYGQRHEMGFSGTENVKAHSRLMTVAFGRKVKDPRQISVRAFSRQIKYAARPFLRPALAEMKPEIVKGMEQALRDAAKVAFT